MFLRLFSVILLAGLSGCGFMPSSGASGGAVRDAGHYAGHSDVPISVIDLDQALTARLLKQQNQDSFSVFWSGSRSEQTDAYPVNPGDGIEVSIWEAPPASLFGGSLSQSSTAGAAAFGVTLPVQVVGTDGKISIPFAGRLVVAGKPIEDIEADIQRRLSGKANQPQILVRVVSNATANVTVVGEVERSARIPLSATGERLLDVLAESGGTRQPVNKMTIQLTRGSATHAMPLQKIITDPTQNIRLEPGDVVTALYQPNSFTVLGAAGNNAEIDFEATGISLAQALARAGGLVDRQADARGVFVFRFERETADGGSLGQPRPVVYRANLDDPATFLLAQQFPIQDNDVLYVATASGAELQKFLNLLVSALFPISNVINLTQ